MYISLLKLILTVPFILILPGFFLLLAIFGFKKDKMPFFEKAVLAVPLSIISVNFSVLVLNKLNVVLKGAVLVGVIVMFCLICFAVFQYRFRKKSGPKKEEAQKLENESEGLYNFSFWQTIFILLSLIIAVFLRVAYLSDTIVPAATDLGHHMFWVQGIVNNGHLPDYGVPDFIIGEHIVFAVVNLVSGVSVLSAFPALILLLANLVGIFTLAILVARLFKDRKITALSIFVIGVLYAISAPQGKYISGGVVGNIFGDMLIPVSLFFLYRAVKEKSALFAGLFLFVFWGLAYIHHLSAFILIYSVAAVFLVYILANLKQAHKILMEWIKIFFKPFPLAVLIFGICFLAFIFTPSYLNPEAINQATGTPQKITRAGLSVGQIGANVGSARFIFGGLGLLLLLIAGRKKPKEYEYSFAVGWALMLLAMTYKPGWLYVNIPSSRVGNYLFLPFSLLAAYGIAAYFELLRRTATRFFSAVLLFTFLFFIVTSGLSDSAEVFKARPQFQETIQVYHSAGYMASALDSNKDVILKDHVNIYGDSWYKLFFMKDYKYPLSRGNLSRYVDPTKPRETCTRDMITEPESSEGQACFLETHVNYIALNAQLEGNSFEKYPEFSKVYSSNYLSIFKRN